LVEEDATVFDGKSKSKAKEAVKFGWITGVLVSIGYMCPAIQMYSKMFW